MVASGIRTFYMVLKWVNWLNIVSDNFPVIFPEPEIPDPD